MPGEVQDTNAAKTELSSQDILAAITALGTSVSARMDSMHAEVTSRMDSMEKNMPAPALKSAADSAAEEKAAKDKKDADDKAAEEKAAKDKKDSEEAEAKAKKDAEDKKAEEDCKMDADPEMYADAQAKADSVYQLHSKTAPRPMAGEKLMAFRARLAKAMQPFSGAWKDTNLGAVAAADATAFTVAEAAIYKDAATAAMTIGSDTRGSLRGITKVDPDTGHRVTTYAGRAGEWNAEFKAPAQLAAGGINRKQKGIQ